MATAGKSTGIWAGSTRIRSLGAALLLGASLAACSPLETRHGYVPTDEQLADVVVGVDTRETVAEVIGSPTSSGVLNESGFYYIAQTKRTVGARAPTVSSREIVAISFDDSGVVSNVERYGLEDGNVVALSRRVTDSNVDGLSLIRQLFGNIGRIALPVE